MAISKETLVNRKNEEYTVDEVMELLGAKVVLPEDNDNYFKNVIGHAEIINTFTEIVKILKSEESIEILGRTYHPSFFLLGIEGIGKTLTTFAFAKEMNLPIIVFNSEKLMQDFSSKMIKGIRKVISQYKASVILFKEVHYGARLDDDKSISFYSKICNLQSYFPDSFFFATASATTTYPPFFVSEDGFDTIISFNPPDPEERQLLIKKFLSQIPHEEKIDIEKMARDFIGQSAGQIFDILKKSFIQCYIHGKNKLDYEIVSNTYYSEMFGGKVRKMSEKEMRLTAYHEAGHVIAGYYGCPDYKVSKVEVVYRSNTLGLTDSEEDEDKLSITREDIEGQIRTCYGGKAAEMLMFKTSTSGVVNDIQTATGLARGYVKNFGMDDSFGSIYVDDDEFYSDTLSSIADVKIQELLIRLEKETMIILLEHKDKLIALAEKLIKKETLYREEILEILEGRKPKAKSPRKK